MSDKFPEMLDVFFNGRRAVSRQDYDEMKSQRDEWKAMYMRMKEKWLDACEKIPATSRDRGEKR